MNAELPMVKQNTYITTQGDCFDSIAFTLWGQEALMHLLIAANPEYLDVIVFPAGVSLVVPAVTPPPKKQGLPPWMQ